MFRSMIQQGFSASSRVHTAKMVYLETFGCQMNELDSELVRGQLSALGYQFTTDCDAADVVLYNTCSVREQAENKVWSRIGLMGFRKRGEVPNGHVAGQSPNREWGGAKSPNRDFILGVIGCMAEREGPAMMRRFPQIDLMCGPGELDKLPMLIDNALKTTAMDNAEKQSLVQFSRVALQGNNNRRSSTLSAATDNLELLDLSRAFDPDPTLGGPGMRRSAYVRITRGCNKFCTYCVVPSTRGAEVHRPPDSIIDECKKLADAGVIEITLLGQTVNHYVYTHGAAVSADGLELPQIGPGWKKQTTNDERRATNDPQVSPRRPTGLTQSGSLARTTSFADLLRRIHDEVPAIGRLRFMTSFPRDFGDDILRVMADSPRICKYLHVPAQSGSNRILKLMNRGYTVEEYLEFIERALAVFPPTEVGGPAGARVGGPAVARVGGPAGRDVGGPGVSIAGDIIVGFPTETDEDFELTKALLRRVPFKNNYIFKYSPRPGTVAIDRFSEDDEVPDEIKRARNSELLALQTEISKRVHLQYVGSVVDVFVEKASERTAKAARVRGAGERTLLTVSAGQSDATRQATIDDCIGSSIVNRQSSITQLSGRTGGDLIAAFKLPVGRSAEEYLGRIVPMRVTGCGPLILMGEVV